ncbi:MAG: DUF3854 domain-containing protein, partial [Verrucomicrobiota bacterium]
MNQDTLSIDKTEVKNKTLPNWVREDLAKSGITVAKANELGIRHVERSEYPSLIGFGSQTYPDGYVIPFYDPETGEAMQSQDGKPFQRIKLAHPVGDAKYFSPKDGGQRAYILPEAHQQFIGGERVALTEGEKKAICATFAGFPMIGLCGNWGWKENDDILPELRLYIRDGDEWLVIWDSDATTKRAFDQATSGLARALTKYNVTLKRVDLPDLGRGEFKTGLDDLLLHPEGGLDRLEQHIRTNARRAVILPARDENLSEDWPSLDSAAFQGIAGEIVRLIEPHTEADPAALLFQFLVFFGNVIGRGPHFKAEAGRHAMVEYLLVIGETAKGRKGTSAGWIKWLFSELDNAWGEKNPVEGLSSGEGLIEEVKDNDVEEYDVDDKRLLVLEGEFASMLKVMRREGNTLSPTLRNLWDSGNHRNIVKTRPAKTTGAHVSVVGHITKHELLRCLDSTEMANGFANRFLFACVKRSKVLPEGGELNESEFKPYLKRLKGAIQFGKLAEELKRDERARQVWLKVYEALSDGRPGILGSVTSRAEAHVMRLASLYALLDESNLISEPHLLAALAMWDYVEQSCMYIFGDATGDPIADTILKALKLNSEGLTRTDISKLFGKNKNSDQ